MFIVPSTDATNFTCPHCGVLAGIEWDKVYVFKGSSKYSFNSGNNVEYVISISTCRACKKPHFWIDDKMVMPVTSGIPMPNEDMSENVKNLYLEAREVFPHSVKASTALLRLALQHLCKELGGEGNNINDDIAKFVKQGLSVKIQQALDAIRVIGNNAVHPGTIDVDDNQDSASLLFDLLNIIVNEKITQPKQIEKLYSTLPQGAIEAIEKRDNYNK